MRRFEICVDANDPSVVLPWWREALGWDEVPAPSGDHTELAPPDGRGDRLWFQQVPEAKVVKNRLHLDVFLPREEVPARQARLVDDLGGSVVDDSFVGDGWVVLADPEGNELCLCFESLRPTMIGVDVQDPALVEPWWQAALGWDEVPSDDFDGATDLLGPGGMRVWFQRVPEAKVVKNRVHLDVYLPPEEVPALQARLVDELGGSVVDDTTSTRFVVLADPEGNELCLCWD